MRGLAKMRELDLRLARTTERARELKIMARQAAEQAERAAVGVARENKARNRNTCGWVGTLLLSRTFDVPSTVVHLLFTSASSNFPAVTESLHRHVEVGLKPLLDTHVVFTNHAAPTHLPLSLSLSPSANVAQTQQQRPGPGGSGRCRHQPNSLTTAVTVVL